MYEAFFGLRHRPFNPLPRVDSYVALTPARDALDALVTCVEQDRGIGVLTAPAGTGKSLICRLLQTRFSEARRTVLLTTGRFPTRRALLQAILFEMKHPYVGLSEQEARLRLLDLLQSSPSPLNRLLLIVDEAHLLSSKGHEELRSLTDCEFQGLPMVSLILAGQLELEETLAEPAMSALNQRVGCHVSIEPLTIEESAIYIRERLRMAGNDGLTIFTSDAIHLICTASEGNPRRLNQLCDHALLLAYAEGTRPVDVAEVRSALLDLRELPLHWNSPVDLGDSAASSPLADYAQAHADDPVVPSHPDDDTAFEFDGAGRTTDEPAAAVYEVGGDENTELDSPVIDQFFHTPEFVFPAKLDADVASFVEILKAPTELPQNNQEPVVENPETDYPTQPVPSSLEISLDRVEIASGEVPRDTVEELTIDDPYAVIDRLQEVRQTITVPTAVELFPIQGAPTLARSEVDEAAAAETCPETLPSQLSDDEQILELVRTLGAEVREARDPQREADASGYQSLREALSWQFDVVEPESEAVPEVQSAANIQTESEQLRLDAGHSVPFVSNGSQDQVPQGDGERKYAQLFTRLQKQRRRVEAVMNRERRTGHETRSN